MLKIILLLTIFPSSLLNLLSLLSFYFAFSLPQLPQEWESSWQRERRGGGVGGGAGGGGKKCRAGRQSPLRVGVGQSGSLYIHLSINPSAPLSVHPFVHHPIFFLARRNFQNPHPCKSKISSLQLLSLHSSERRQSEDERGSGSDRIWGLII